MINIEVDIKSKTEDEKLLDRKSKKEDRQLVDTESEAEDRQLIDMKSDGTESVKSYKRYDLEAEEEIDIDSYEMGTLH